MTWRRYLPGRLITRLARNWSAASVCPFLPMMRPASLPSISRRMSSGGSSSSFSSKSTVQSIPMPASTSMVKSSATSARPSSTNGSAGWAGRGSAASVAAPGGGIGASASGRAPAWASPAGSCSTDTCFSLSKSRRRLLAAARRLLLHLDLPRRPLVALQVPLDEELLPDGEAAVRQHVQTEACRQKEHHEGVDARHRVHHHLLLRRVALRRHDPLLEEAHGAEDDRDDEERPPGRDEVRDEARGRAERDVVELDG